MQVSRRKSQEELLILENEIDIENAPLVLTSVILMKETEIQHSTKPHVKYKLTSVCCLVCLLVGCFFSEFKLDCLNQTTQ